MLKHILIPRIDVHSIVTDSRDIARENLRVNQDRAKHELSKEEQECHQIFRLTNNNEDATYEWFKDRVEERVEQTCLWFLQHDYFQSWLQEESGPLLVTADPGCGKSVLAKYLVDHYLPNHPLCQSTTICYFFFKDQVQNTTRQALCALLHQLFSYKPALIKYAMEESKKDGVKLKDSTRSLWNVLARVIEDPEAGRIIIVLDALDECDTAEFGDLVRNIDVQACRDSSCRKGLKCLLTSRPYEQITSEFHHLLERFPNILIPAEDKSETISQEINRVITYRVDQLSERKGLKLEIKHHLEKTLQATAHRTYLWVHLVFDYLDKEGFEKTELGVEAIVTTLPATANEAYEKILSRCKKIPTVRKVLCIMLSASRPLTLSEMNVATSIDETSQSFHHLGKKLEDEDDFKSRLRDWCGLFVSIYHGRIYFLHQTAREFLLADPSSLTPTPSNAYWFHSIAISQAHAVLAEVSVRFLDLFNVDHDSSTAIDGDGAAMTAVNAFKEYSARNWTNHFRQAGIMHNTSVVSSASRLCHSDSKSYPVWYDLFWTRQNKSGTGDWPDFMRASYLGLDSVVKLLVEKVRHNESKVLWYMRRRNGVIEAEAYGRTSLWLAASEGHEKVVKVLLDNHARVNTSDGERNTPLLLAARNGHERVVELLLEKGARVNTKNIHQEAPLAEACRNGHESVVKLLLDKGALANVEDRYRQTPLIKAAKHGKRRIVKLLLENRARVDTKDQFGITALMHATRRNETRVCELLLWGGAKVDERDKDTYTPLMRAAEYGDSDTCALLLKGGAQIDNEHKNGRTALSWAAGAGQRSIVNLLLRDGAQIDKEDQNGRTALSWASRAGQKSIVNILLKEGARIDKKEDEWFPSWLNVGGANRKKR